MSGTSSPEQRRKLALEYYAEKAAAYIEGREGTARTPSRTYGNAVMPAGTPKDTGIPVMGTSRDGADQHKQYTGAGFRAQIERNV
jgi:hypothetical protein